VISVLSFYLIVLSSSFLSYLSFFDAEETLFSESTSSTFFVLLISSVFSYFAEDGVNSHGFSPLLDNSDFTLNPYFSFV